MTGRAGEDPGYAHSDDEWIGEVALIRADGIVSGSLAEEA
jgi:hypothetical protein